MKTFCESGTFQRGQEAVSGDASIAMFGNQAIDVMVQTGHLFAPMPDGVSPFQQTAEEIVHDAGG